MAARPTIKEVANRAGVSVATVSRVLNNLEGYSQDTRDTVQKAIEELGYQRNAVARNLKLQKTNTIAFLMPRVETIYYVNILNGVEDIAQKLGYTVIICQIGVKAGHTKQYIDMLVQRQVDGILGCSLPPGERLDRQLTATGIPCVLVSTASHGYQIPCVKVDDFRAMYAATCHLIDHGHRQIALLAGAADDPVAGVPREQGFRQAMRDKGLTVDDRLVRYTSYGFESGRRAFRSLMQQPASFTAVAAASDDVAVGAMSEAHAMGIRVPEDLSVIGYDNTITAQMAIPPLTAVSQPLYEMGKIAFELLYSQMETGKKPADRVLPFEIVERQTVRRIE